MKPHAHKTAFWVLASLCTLFFLGSCADSSSQTIDQASVAKAPRYIASIIDEPDTVDFQCTTINYTVALNVFDRLVETRTMSDGSKAVVPMLARTWELSDDGCTYTFELRDDVTFSNGNTLNASDVLYTFTRLLSHPDSRNQDILSEVVGAGELMDGSTDTLSGFIPIDDTHFQIVLEKPFAAFLPSLCMPSASIMDEQTTEAAGDSFGHDAASMVGSGPFVLAEWEPGSGMLLRTNPNYWGDVPSYDGVSLSFEDDPNNLADMFEAGEIDILNVDDLGDQGDYYLRGDAYAGQVHAKPYLGIDYIALNASAGPLSDVRVRKALQLAINRKVLLDAAYSGDGTVENGIFPKGLTGHNPDLRTIPYDPAQAHSLLAQAGYPDGFDLVVSMRTSSPRWQRQLLEAAKDMWEHIGVHATIDILGEDEFMDRRSSGKLVCYTASWAADFDDPDNFIYPFFGSAHNTRNRSLCYTNEEVMARVRAARSIVDDNERIAEYQDLERTIVQDDAAWIPLFSRNRHFLVSSKIEYFAVGWNGWYETVYKDMVLAEE